MTFLYALNPLRHKFEKTMAFYVNPCPMRTSFLHPMRSGTIQAYTGIGELSRKTVFYLFQPINHITEYYLFFRRIIAYLVLAHFQEAIVNIGYLSALLIGNGHILPHA